MKKIIEKNDLTEFLVYIYVIECIVGKLVRKSESPTTDSKHFSRSFVIYSELRPIRDYFSYCKFVICKSITDFLFDLERKFALLRKK